MARVSASEFVDKWGRRTKAATTDYQNGVNKVTEAPGVAAARQAQLMLAKITEALSSGRWADAVSSVPLSAWKDAAIKKGVQRIAAGVDGATPSMASMAQQLLTNIDAAVAEANRTPRGTLEDNINRMVTFARHMATNGKLK